METGHTKPKKARLDLRRNIRRRAFAVANQMYEKYTAAIEQALEEDRLQPDQVDTCTPELGDVHR